MKEISIDPALLAELRAKHGELYRADHADETIIFREPRGKDWRVYQGLLLGSAPAERPAAYETLVRLCTVWPAKLELDQMFDRRPGVVQAFAGEISEVAGAVGTAKTSKL